MDPAKIQALEDRLGHNFTDRKKLYQALTHSTFSNVEKKKQVGARDCPHQEAYAVLGDAILKTVFVWMLMDRGHTTKGDITKLKEDLENNLKLAEVGKRLRLLEDELFIHNVGSEEKLREGADTYYSDTVEALIGAIFIDSKFNFSMTRNSISKIFAQELANLERDVSNC